VLFGGKPPADPNAPIPPSGALKVTTTGTTTVTSTASVTNVGPGPFTADSIKSTCRASASGVTASTTVTNGVVATATDADGNPTTTKAVPLHPIKGYTINGKITNVGDSFKAVFNEQTVNANGSVTVDALHLYLLGPTAVGDLVIAQSRCGV
jgi:hypothetical protein